MKKSRLYGGIVSFCLVVLAAAGISTIGFKKDAENQNNTGEIVRDEPHKEVVVNNTPPFYTTSVEKVENVDDIEDTVENNEVSTDTLIVTMVNTIISFLSSFIVLPKIIAEYLYNSDEEKDMTELIKNIQERDKTIRANMKD